MLALPKRAAASASVRALAFQNTHTGEALALPYARGGTLLPDALRAFDNFLRDFRTGESHPIDPALFDHRVRMESGSVVENNLPEALAI